MQSISTSSEIKWGITIADERFECHSKRSNYKVSTSVEARLKYFCWLYNAAVAAALVVVVVVAWVEQSIKI